MTEPRKWALSYDIMTDKWRAFEVKGGGACIPYEGEPPKNIILVQEVSTQTHSVIEAGNNREDWMKRSWVYLEEICLLKGIIQGYEKKKDSK